MIIVKCECGLQTPIRVWPFYCRCKRVYASGGNQPRVTSAEAIAFDGPGTELKKLLAELGITSFAGCSCEYRTAQMNLWGVNGCREHFDEIREWLIKAQAQAGWYATLTAATRAATSGLALRLDPLDIAGSLVRLAIERHDDRPPTSDLR